MGIPSYFKHLLDRYPRLLTPAGPDTKANVLLMDFNCLIYGCVHSKSLPAYSHATREDWETALLKEICTYVVHLWSTAGKPGQVVLAVDGIVPMAKIRQQRLRRFKSVWLTGKEREFGARPVGEELWDTNCITPGTEFMERLTVKLEELCSKRSGWIVSGAEKPGEGEQKLMEWVRSAEPGALDGKHLMVYGLDADLILLCMLHANLDAAVNWSILREKQEFIKVAVPNQEAAAKYPSCLLLSITGLLTTLFPDPATCTAHLYDYIAGMSLLGNDFIPHSLGVHLKDAGHDRLVAVLATIHSEGVALVSQELAGGEKKQFWRWNPVALKKILEFWGSTEEADLEHAFKRKFAMRTHPPKTQAERVMLPLQNLPLESGEEGRMWNRATGKLYPDWRAQYSIEKRERALTSVEIEERCSEYFKGLQWVLDYYTGQRPISEEWMFPWTYPPLWTDLRVFLEGNSLPEVLGALGSSRIQPQEQLTLVLPLESWSLIRNPVLKAVPAAAPHFWPRSFTFTTLGKRWMWECPPDIPILTLRRLLALTTSKRTVT